MATSLDRYLIASLLDTTDTTLLFGPNDGEEFFIGRFTATNTDPTSNVTLTIWTVGSGDTPTTGSGGNFLDTISIPKGRTVTIDKIEGQTLVGTQVVQAKASIAGVVRLNASGATET